MEWNWFYIPYVLNILILIPVCYQMIWGRGVVAVFDAKVAESEGLRLLVASLWSAILVGSIAGLIYPEFFSPILLIQIFYKSMWLVVYSFRQRRKVGIEAFPAGISITFIAICVVYPFFVYLQL